MSKRAHSDSLAEVSAADPGGWLNLGRPGQASVLGRDIRKLFFSRLTDQDKDMIKRAHGVKDVNPIDRRLIFRCSKRGHWDIVKWAITLHPELYSHHVVLFYAMKSNMPMVDWLNDKFGSDPTFIKKVARMAAFDGLIQYLGWLDARGYRPTQDNAREAVHSDDPVVLDWVFRGDGIIWDQTMSDETAFFMCRNTRQWAIDHGYMDAQ